MRNLTVQCAAIVIVCFASGVCSAGSYTYTDLGPSPPGPPVPSFFHPGGEDISSSAGGNAPFVSVFGIDQFVSVTQFNKDNPSTVVEVGGVDENGKVWGTYFTAQDQTEPFLFTPGKGTQFLGYITVGSPGDAVVRGFNDSGEMVVLTFDGLASSYLYTQSAGAISLDALAPTGISCTVAPVAPCRHFDDVVAISNSGSIFGVSADYEYFGTRQFLLVPPVMGAVPEPQTYLLMLAGLLVASFAFRRRQISSIRQANTQGSKVVLCTG